MKICLSLFCVFFLYWSVRFAVEAASSSHLNSRCKALKTILNIKPGQEGVYETAIPEFLASDAVVYINTDGMSIKEIEIIKDHGLRGEWLIKDKNGKEIVKNNLLFNSGWSRDGGNYPACYFCVRRNAEAPGKFIVRVKKTENQPFVPSDCQLVFRSFVEFGPMITMLMIMFSAGAFFIALFSGFTLYKVILFYRTEKQKDE